MKSQFFLPKWVRGSTNLSNIVWMLCKVSHSSNGLVNLGPPCLFSANEAPEPPMQCRLLIQYKPKRTLDIRTICPIQNHKIFIHIGYHNSRFLVKQSQLSCCIPPFLSWAWSYARKSANLLLEMISMSALDFVYFILWLPQCHLFGVNAHKGKVSDHRKAKLLFTGHFQGFE